jgi:hypothetical protein
VEQSDVVEQQQPHLRVEEGAQHAEPMPDPALAADTLAIALSDELPANLAQNLIYWVASAGEQPALAWDFVRANFDTLSAGTGHPSATPLSPV